MPPTALKSDHLRSPLIGELWQRAAKALASASRIALLGYSLPPADRSFSEMLAHSVLGRDVAIEVVNPNAPDVISHLEHIGVDRAAITPHEGSDCIARWVKREVSELAAATVVEIGAAGFDGEELLTVSGLLNLGDRVESDGGDLVLTLVPRGNPVSAAPRIGSLLERLVGSDRVVLDVGDRRIPVIGLEVFRQPNVTGASLDQIQFILAGKP